jgi:predicted PhzF superfamily epimerase YddE/YHI9
VKLRFHIADVFTDRPLAGNKLDRTSLVVEQGVEIGRPSVIEVDASEPQPRVGGRVAVVASGELDLP